MMKNAIILLILMASLGTGCVCTVKTTRSVTEDSGKARLVGAWRAKVQFKTGSFATVKDLEFLYVFNAGGTMTESSNYDESPPVAPAYGVWRKTGQRQYESKSVFYTTKPPENFGEIAKGNGWSPAGHGVIVEKISLSGDGKSYHSTLRFDAFDPAGKPAETGSEATVEAVRITF